MAAARRGILAVCLLLCTSLAAEDVRAESAVAQQAMALFRACSEKRFSDASEYLHSSLRRTWVELGYRTTQYCEMITRGYTLKDVRIRVEEDVAPYAVVDLTFVYADGTSRDDRATFLREGGTWRLAN